MLGIKNEERGSVSLLRSWRKCRGSRGTCTARDRLKVREKLLVAGAETVGRSILPWGCASRPLGVPKNAPFRDHQISLTGHVYPM